jgi:hypothetical protein
MNEETVSPPQARLLALIHGGGNTAPLFGGKKVADVLSHRLCEDQRTLLIGRHCRRNLLLSRRADHLLPGRGVRLVIAGTLEVPGVAVSVRRAVSRQRQATVAVPQLHVHWPLVSIRGNAVCEFLPPVRSGKALAVLSLEARKTRPTIPVPHHRDQKRDSSDPSSATQGQVAVGWIELH